jgi:hypothetical protein
MPAGRPARSFALSRSRSLADVTDPHPHLAIQLDELLLEGMAGPSAQYVYQRAVAVNNAVCRDGATLESAYIDRLLSMLGDPEAFVNQPTEPSHVGERARSMVTGILLAHAYRTGDPGLVTRLRAVADIFDPYVPVTVPAPCLIAQFDGIAREPLAVRDAAMRQARHLYQTDLAPILDIVVGELAAPEQRDSRRLTGRHLIPAVVARETLVAYALRADDLPGLRDRVATAVDPGAPTQSALRTLAALHAVEERFDQITARVAQVSTRAELIGGIRDAIARIAWNLSHHDPVPNPQYPFEQAIDVATTLATNAGHRKQIAEIRTMYDRLQRNLNRGNRSR